MANDLNPGSHDLQVYTDAITVPNGTVYVYQTAH